MSKKGWYGHPTEPNLIAEWDGEKWTGATAPKPPPNLPIGHHRQTHPRDGSKQLTERPQGVLSSGSKPKKNRQTVKFGFLSISVVALLLLILITFGQMSGVQETDGGDEGSETFESAQPTQTDQVASEKNCETTIAKAASALGSHYQNELSAGRSLKEKNLRPAPDEEAAKVRPSCDPFLTPDEIYSQVILSYVGEKDKHQNPDIKGLISSSIYLFCEKVPSYGKLAYEAQDACDTASQDSAEYLVGIAGEIVREG